MKLRTALAALAVGCTLAACEGNSADLFRGAYTGTWVSTADATDRGTSSWGINGDGRVVGIDFDPNTGTRYYVVGTITGGGVLKSTATPDDGSAAASLNGKLTFDAEGRLTGILVWGTAPPQSYVYTLTPQQ